MPAANPQADEDAKAFLLRVARLEIDTWPRCRLGRWHVVEVRQADRALLRAISPACLQGPAMTPGSWQQPPAWHHCRGRPGPAFPGAVQRCGGRAKDHAMTARTDRCSVRIKRINVAVVVGSAPSPRKMLPIRGSETYTIVDPPSLRFSPRRVIGCHAVQPTRSTSPRRPINAMS